MIALLIHNPLLLLFLVAALGYSLGRVTIAGTSLGVAAVLFVGLAFGALDPEIKLPELIYQLGLVVFVYTIGISSGRAFFVSLRHQGLRDNLFIAGMLVVAAALAVLLGRLIGLTPAVAAGMFTGSLTNTPALAAVVETVKATAPAADIERLLAEPVVGYSIAYPMGVIGMLIVIVLMRRVWHIDFAAEAVAQQRGGAQAPLLNQTVTVTRPDVANMEIADLVTRGGWDVTFGRIMHGGQLALAGATTRLSLGDQISVIGSADSVLAVASALGEPTADHLADDRSQFDFRRIFVSSSAIAGRRLRDLRLPQRFGGTVTRVRRGDTEFVAHGDTVLELGDRVRVVARPEQMPAVARFFGDSYRALSEIDILTFTLGLALGLVLGMVPLPLPGGLTIKLGVAGGPLVVALILGALERTGPLVWNLPYSANLTLRQFGLILFLAGVGTRSGYAFVHTLQQGGGLPIFLGGLTITVGMALLLLFAGYKLLRIPYGTLIGMLAAFGTQPAVLGFALEQTGDERPNAGYAAVYPVALIVKIICAQLVLTLLR